MAITNKVKASPRARRFAADYLVNLAKIPGSSGMVGRITENDVRRYLENSGYFQHKITPAALNLAKREQVDMSELSASGDYGRILLDDVRNAITERPREMSAMRKIISERLTYSKQTIPHFYVTVSVEMDTVMKLRRQLREQEIDFSVNVFIIKATAKALNDFPILNAETDGKTIRRNTKINIGMAVSVDNGLMVPVIRNAARKYLDEIQLETAELADKARNGKLAPDDMKGGTFTVSNIGMMNVENFCAIINPGESAILAVSSCIPTPVVRDGGIMVRDMMKITLSADHRIIDGSVAAGFINRIKEYLENEDFWNLEM